jgi:hypothetical protein
MPKKPKNIHSCPSCEGALTVRVLECTDCGLRLEGSFSREPLLELDAEELAFVRLFIHCEGSIRDMEKALGISYPTVKAKLVRVRAKLGSGGAGVLERTAAPENVAAPSPAAKSVIEKLADGELDFNEALNALKWKENDDA